MSEDIKSKANMAALLEEELEALERQRDQYALAMDSATDPKVAIRLQRTLERIEDEIEGVQETIAALPEQANVAEPEVAAPEPEVAVAEPEVTEPEPEREVAEREVTEPEPEPEREVTEREVTEPEVTEPVPKVTEPEPEVTEPEPEPEPEAEVAEPEPEVTEPEPEAEVAEPEVEVSPEPEAPAVNAADQEWDDEPSTAIYEPERVRAQLAELDAMRKQEEAEEAGAALDAVAGADDPVATQPPAEPEPDVQEDEEEDVGGTGNPLGPVWMDPVSPPAGNLSDDEIAEAAGSAPEPEPASPDVLGDDPFAMPSRPAAPFAAEPSSPFGAAGGDASPFGAAPHDASFGSPAAGSGFGNPISVLDDDVQSADWGFGAKALLFLIVAGFVAGAFYIMSIG